MEHSAKLAATARPTRPSSATTPPMTTLPGQRVVGRATEHVAMDPVTDHQMSTPK